MPGGGRGGGRRGPVAGSDPGRVLDKGVWKRVKPCQHCQQMITERAKWRDCWNEIRFCSDRCKAEGKRARRQQGAAVAGEGPPQPQAPAPPGAVPAASPAALEQGSSSAAVSN